MKTLLYLTLGGSALALLLLIIGKLFSKKIPACVYYYAWLLVLLRFLIPLPGLVPVTGTRSPEPVQQQETEISVEQTDPYEAPEISGGYKAVETAGISDKRPVPAVPSEPETAAAIDPTSADPVSRSGLHIDLRSGKLWASIWAAGAIIGFSVCVISYLHFTRIIRRDLTEPDIFTRSVYIELPGKKPALYLSENVPTPMMFGLFSPKIVLPERRYSDEELRNIFRHELMHFRRRDTLYKWFSVLVLSLHWFNPLTLFIRRQIDRSCELSCDEMLLRSMDRGAKESYGKTLLNMAAASALPTGVVATTFSTEKKNLKERLEQIMNYKKSKTRILAAVLALVLMAGCGAVAGPQNNSKEPEPADDPNAAVIKVSTVDEFLAAIGPDTIIELAEGTYDLSTAKDYAASAGKYYSWNDIYDEGGELEIHNAHNLTIRGEGAGKTVIAAVPRYANVIRFANCTDLRVSDLTAGHTQAPGYCSGGVLLFDYCNTAAVDKCSLYGCGTVGVTASNSTDVKVSSTEIYECSNGAIESYSSRNVRVEDCDVYSCGTKEGDSSAFCMFYAANSDGFAVYDSRIYNNRTQMLFYSFSNKNAMFLSNTVKNNDISSAAFACYQYSATVDGCSFKDNTIGASWSGSGIWGGEDNVPAKDAEGRDLPEEAFELMKFKKIDPDSVWSSVPLTAAADVPAGGQIKVSSIDELIQAIGPDRTIILEAGTYDLSAAAGYGISEGEYFYWEQRWDGPQLVIRNVSGLTVSAESEDPKATVISAVPRYANVLSFVSCKDIELMGFTAGHTKEPGECAGGVLYFEGCGDLRLESCRLYGCGILGIETANCNSITVDKCEIYECSFGAVNMHDTDGISFRQCNIHDVPSPAVTFYNCGDKYWNGNPVTGLDSYYDVGPDGALLPYGFEESGSGNAPSDLFPENPFAGADPVPFEEGSPMLQFARAVQKDIAGKDWESLADKLNFPLNVYSYGVSAVIQDRETFLSWANDTNLLPDEFCRLIADAPLDAYGSSIFGNTFAFDRIAMSCFGDTLSYENMKVTCISTDLSLR
ncbi:MAG: right-handed parallel beta-helix repeat-containing protein [Oscillospiraceae bacterium]|nr:right-handed parallel beta-helix repeat-containing protein [Oscillospiraceae bacterium]